MELFPKSETTNEVKGADAVTILEPKIWTGRVATLQLLIRGDGKLMDACLVIKGKAAHLLKVRRPRKMMQDLQFATHRGIKVLVQDNAWMDTAMCVLWARTVLRDAVDFAPTDGRKVRRGEEMNLLIVDNLSSQTTPEFVRACRHWANTLVWCLPPNCTDLVQPVDASIGNMIKGMIKSLCDEWMDRTEAGKDKMNYERALDGDKEFTANFRRRKLFEWVSAAWTTVRGDDVRTRSIKRAFEKTGCTVAIDGSNSAAISPQHLNKLPGGFTFDVSTVA